MSPNSTVGLAGVAVVGVGAVGRDLDGLAGDLRADRAERAADVPVRLGDRLHDREDLVGRGIRREVEVVDAAAEERVAHRAADERELVARDAANAAASVATVGEAASSPSRSRAAATLCMPPC